ncbi:unnamed protein product [Arabidopsis arenosa]|uniref:Uncharacterized protein n=1 Tax=Arabidopsis arenosa TaxID=38785 RepID=A0A8S1ZPT4_ARAAE|nr:unnamed protein product [Arabidopsis arenosa]
MVSSLGCIIPRTGTRRTLCITRSMMVKQELREQRRQWRLMLVIGADGADSRVSKSIDAFQCDHVAVGTGTVTHKGDIKKFQLATRNRAKDKILGGKITHVEAHPVPEHPRPCRLSQRVAHVGVAAGYVTKFSGEGIYFAAKNGRMCAETTVEGSQNVKKMIDEGDLRKYVQGA